MTKDKRSRKIDGLFRREEWEAARKLLEAEQEKEPENHWVLTQIGVTYYEQRRYEEALRWFEKSWQIVADCPLTMWNLAGTLDALGHSDAAMEIYTWLLQNQTSPDDDPCWESGEWTDQLKADCVYRLGACFQHLGKKQTAEHCFRQYMDLLLAGIGGSYSIEDVARQIQGLHNAGARNGTKDELRKVVDSTLRASGIEPRKGRRSAPPELKMGEFFSGRRAANRRSR